MMGVIDDDVGPLVPLRQDDLFPIDVGECLLGQNFIRRPLSVKFGFKEKE